MKYYEILDIPSDATPEQIKAAYRILVQLHHPDRLQQANASVRAYAEERLKKINEAYTTLSDPDKRQRYDATHLKTARAATAAYATDEDDEDDGVVYPQRTYSRHATEQAAYRAWMNEEKEREAEARATGYAERRAQQEAQARREAEEKAQRAAAEAYPRLRVEETHLILTLAPGLWAKFIHLPAGEFLMGSDPIRDAQALRHELPQHRVSLTDYFIGQYPVTNAQYQAFVKATRHQSDVGVWQAPPGQENHPAVNVTWDDAMAFCKWLTSVTGREFRLPTEAQWERAARSEDGRIYAWGDAWEAARANGGGAHAGTTPVGQFSPLGDSPYGLADMAGNVWEWCADWFSPQTYGRRSRAVTPNPAGANSGEGCVIRGGAFDSSPKQLRCAHRNFQYPYKAFKNVGFRLVAAAT